MPACDMYHLPNHVSHHVDYITPGIKLFAPESHKTKRDATLTRVIHDILQHDEVQVPDPNDLSTCDKTITPACVAALYQIPPGNLSNPNNSMGIFESELQFWTQQDLDLFFTNFTSIPNGTHPIPKNIDGGQQATDDPYEAGGEVNLDLMLAYPIVHPQTITDYQVDDFIVQANQEDTYTFGFNTLLDAFDGVSQTRYPPALLIMTSLTAHLLRSMKQEMIQTLIQYILIPILEAIQVP